MFPARSLELLFASSQNTKLLYGEPPKSPRANRKFSSPPPLSITKSSSPSRRRKLSLNIPIITGGKALDLAALGCAPNGYASMYSSVSPFSKTSLDIHKLYVSSNYAGKLPDEGEGPLEKPEEPLQSKPSECLQLWGEGGLSRIAPGRLQMPQRALCGTSLPGRGLCRCSLWLWKGLEQFLCQLRWAEAPGETL